MRKIYVTLFLLLLPVIVRAKVTISISNQKSFPLLQKELEEAIASGETDIVINIRAGEYVFKEQQISLKDVNNPNLRIQIHGEKAILIPEGINYNHKDNKVGGLNIYHGWMDGMNDLPIWSNIKKTEQLIEVINLDDKICRLKSLTPIKDSDGRNQNILITQWYKSGVYPILKIEDNYIYFKATDLAKSVYKKNEYNINDDFNYQGKYPRYKLNNVDLGVDGKLLLSKKGKMLFPQGISEVHECKVSTFLILDNCRINLFKMDNLEFRGSANGYPNSFITIKNVMAKNIYFNNCTFYGMHNNVISITNSKNVTVLNNMFDSIYFMGIQSDNGSANTKVINNSFLNAGLGMSNTFCVFCSGNNYLIRGNKLVDYGYGGIRVGLWYLNKQHDKSNGVVEDNTLLFTDSYINTISEDGLMDGGAIYISTINDKAIVRNNYINGFSGAGGNRGIFCDDGAMGYEIYGNVILNISRRDYCIASRREPSVENRNDSRSSVQKSNVNNIIRDNILDGKILFKGHESLNNGCRKGVNYILLLPDEEGPQNAISHIWRAAKDIVIENRGVEDNKFLVTKSDYKKIEKSKEWNYLKRYVKAINDRK